MADIRITPAASIMAFTSSLNFKETLTQEASGSLTLLGSGSTGRTDLFTINGNNGTLFSVSDDLSNSLFSVNTIAGLPVIEAFADNTVVMGQYGQNVLVVTGSRVGIGTSSPIAKLHVGGTSYFTDEQSILYTNAVQTMYGGTGYSLFRIYGNSNSVEMQMDVHSSNSGAATIGTYTNNGVYIKTNNTNRITITSGGLVGIGTAPSYKLDVNGAGRFIFRNNSNEIMDLLLSTEGAASKSKLSLLWYGNETAALKFARGSNSTGGSMEFWTQPTNGSITQIMTVAENGNVGIGSSPPGSKLEIAGALGGTVGIGGSTIRLVNTDSGAKASITAGITGVTNDGMQLSVDGTARMVIGGTGNVGIGVTSPDTNLDVIGDSLTVGSESTYAFRVRGGGGGKPITISSDGSFAYIQSWSGGPLQINNQGNNTLLNATSGYVGIGTTTPQKRLDAISDANDFITVGANSISAGQWSGIHFGYRENNTNYRKSAIVFERTDLTSANAQGKVHILNGPQSGGGSATLSDAKITIAENGNVGIGTTSPSYKLHTVNEAFIGNSGGTTGLLLSGDTNSRIDFRSGSASTGQITCGNSSNLFIDAFDSRAIELAIAGTTIFEVSPNGNVGVGTAGNVEPSAALEVKSNTQGFLLPRMDDGEMNAIGGPAIGLMVYNTSDDYVYVFGGASWAKLAYV
jgi:hypothetical protein